MVEAAFVMPVFVLMIFGIFEFAGNIMTRTGANASVKAGARMAVVAGNDAMSDREILDRMAEEGAGIQQDHVEQVIIWHATSASQPVPSACKDDVGFHVVDTANQCNVYNDPQNEANGAYTKAALPLSSTLDPSSTFTLGPDTADYWFGCDTSSPDGAALSGPKLDCGWEPNRRRILQKPPNYTCVPNPQSDPKCRPTDLIGIYIRVRHQNYTGFFGSGITVEAQTISTIEPQGYDR